MTIDMNPRTQGIVHPEQKVTEFFIGNFDPNFAEKKIPWKTKRIGITSFQDNGVPYPSTMRKEFKPVPVFVSCTEFLLYHSKILRGESRVNTFA